MRHQGANPDIEIARIANRQHGVISVRQLRASGLDKSAVKRRAASGRLHPIHRGVYAVGYSRLSREGRWMAAVLAYGPGAVVSHRSAASLWRLLPERPGAAVDISVPSAGGKKTRRGTCIHRRAALPRENVTRHRGIPVTNPACTIVDLRTVVTHAEARQAIRQAAMLGLSIGPAGLDGPPTPDGTRSELEYQFLRLCKRHRLPTPEVNVRIGSLLVDFVWPDRKLVIETDGYRYHRGRQAFEDDRARDLWLRSQGYDVIRLTYEQVTKSPEATAAILRKVLSRHVTT